MRPVNNIEMKGYFYHFGDEGGLLLVESLTWVRLNESSAFIITELQRGDDGSRIAAKISAKYSIETRLAQASVESVLKFLGDLGLSIINITSLCNDSAPCSHESGIAMCAKEVMRRAGFLNLEIASASMSPLLAKGANVKIRLAAAKQGDILCYVRGASFVVHRVVGIENDLTALTRGDFEVANIERVPPDRQVGIVDEFRFGDRWISARILSINPYLSRFLYFAKAIQTLCLSALPSVQAIVPRKLFRWLFESGASALLNRLSRRFGGEVFVSGSFSRGDFEFGSSDLDCYFTHPKLNIELVLRIEGSVSREKFWFPFFRAVCLVSDHSMNFIRANLGVRGFEIKPFSASKPMDVQPSYEMMELSCIRELAASVGFISYAFARFRSRSRSHFNSELPAYFWQRAVSKHLVEILRYSSYLELKDPNRIKALAQMSHDSFLDALLGQSETLDRLRDIAELARKLWRKNSNVTPELESEIIRIVGTLLETASEHCYWDRWIREDSEPVTVRRMPCIVEESWKACFDALDNSQLELMRISQNLHQFFETPNKISTDMATRNIIKGFYSRALYDLGESIGGKRWNFKEFGLRLFLFDAYLNCPSESLNYKLLSGKISGVYRDLYSACLNSSTEDFFASSLEKFLEFQEQLTERIIEL